MIQNRPAVFLDRDGVIVRDNGLLESGAQPVLLDGVPRALARLVDRGFTLVVVSNQPIIARGLATETEVLSINANVRKEIEDNGGPALEHFYYCPHHPNANVAAYRVDCECRKPKSGLLARAASDLSLSLPRSFIVGDRITDIMAGAAAGCRTVLVETGRHLDPPIETSVAIPEELRADFVCRDLSAAAEWILNRADV